MPATPAHTNGARSSGFTGRPSLQARISAPALRLLRSIAGLVGVDLGTSINTLIASRRPPRRTTKAVTVRHRQFNGWDLSTLRPESPSMFFNLQMKSCATGSKPLFP